MPGVTFVIRRVQVRDVITRSFRRLPPPPEKAAPKTFYFGMDEALSNESRNCVDQQVEQIQSRLQAREGNGSIECALDYTDDVSLQLSLVTITVFIVIMRSIGVYICNIVIPFFF